MGIYSPLTSRLARWQDCLREHQDSSFSSYILEGIEKGFVVGFDHTRPLRSATANMNSAQMHPEVVDAYVAEELAGGRIFGPFFPTDILGLHLNRMGVIPKGHIPERWRLITDLSFPPEGSVNEGIDSELCSLHYTSVERVAIAAQQLGKGALLAKVDVKAAYRLVPVNPQDRLLLGFQWRGKHYVDAMLPFGLRSAPKIFTALADALEWILRQHGVVHIDHYLDDFITMGPPGSDVCKQNLDIISATCADLGVPLAEEKLEGPSECLTFLGIEIDTRAGLLRLPAEKLTRLQRQLRTWAPRKVCRRRQLESLIGVLQHAGRVVRPGRTFTRRMIDLLSIRGAQSSHHHIRLNQQFQADLQWWRVFAAHWNGVSVFPLARKPALEVTSDASGNWGCGAWSQKSWLQYQWPDEALQRHISFKELFALLLAAVTWGSCWKGVRVQWYCDNQAAVRAVSSRSCRDQPMMHLIRCLFFIEAWYQFEMVASHLPGHLNTLADDLSRNRRDSFLSKAQSMEAEPSQIHPDLPVLLLEGKGWMSPAWTTRFSSILRGV